ncbi:MAG: GNAT family N-acetyltransferase [Zoogloeaceae bacterium]|jgi:GNAT superfamily N-acetyltransferase|nr:GNAT family N-acetyltransferase [Zoogloeaceae bacterium]
MTLEIIPVTDDAGAIAPAAAKWLPKAEVVHRQLRERLPSGYEAYRATLRRVFANGGRFTLAVEGEAVKGVALWRIVENTCEGRGFFVDDLVVDAACRSQGVGKALILWLENLARNHQCDALTLTSGVQRSDAHRFYFREGFTIPSFCFRKKLT